jgi:hypothetical protein
MILIMIMKTHLRLLVTIGLLAVAVTSPAAVLVPIDPLKIAKNRLFV